MNGSILGLVSSERRTVVRVGQRRDLSICWNDYQGWRLLTPCLLKWLSGVTPLPCACSHISLLSLSFTILSPHQIYHQCIQHIIENLQPPSSTITIHLRAQRLRWLSDQMYYTSSPRIWRRSVHYTGPYHSLTSSRSIIWVIQIHSEVDTTLIHIKQVCWQRTRTNFSSCEHPVCISIFRPDGLLYVDRSTRQSNIYEGAGQKIICSMKNMICIFCMMFCRFATFWAFNAVCLSFTKILQTSSCSCRTSWPYKPISSPGH